MKSLFGSSLMKTTADFPRDKLQYAHMSSLTPLAALQTDKRFSFCLYVPEEHYLPTPDASKLPLLVAVHGSSRQPTRSRANFIPLADELGMAILAPLWPMGMSGSNEHSGYKRLDEGELRYDQLLCDILDEVGHRSPGIDTHRFFIAGFSGGGQFVQTFLYLHSHRIYAASIR